MLYGPAPLLRRLGLDAERIIVLFSAKGVNRMAYLAHVVTVVWCVCCCLSNSYAIVFRHNRRFNCRSQFHDRQKPNPLISRRAVRRRHYRPRFKSQKTARSVVGVEPTNFRTAATDYYKDKRLYRDGHRRL